MSGTGLWSMACPRQTTGGDYGTSLRYGFVKGQVIDPNGDAVYRYLRARPSDLAARAEPGFVSGRPGFGLLVNRSGREWLEAAFPGEADYSPYPGDLPRAT